MNSNQTAAATNIAILPKSRPPQNKVAQRFTILEFIRPRTGEVSWRVTGSKIGGARIRENFKTEAEARVRHAELLSENLQVKSDIAIKATRLDDARLQLAEEAFRKLGDDWERIVDAVDHWKKTGTSLAAKESPRLDDAVAQYLTWLAGNSFRDATKRHWKIRMNVFKGSTPNIKIAEFTPEHIDAYLATRKVSASGKDTDRRAVSRFFSWCIYKDRRWATSNPCRKVIDEDGGRRDETPPTAVLTIDECVRLLRSAEKHKAGLLVPYVAACLFAGLRPFEASRLTWDQVNLTDNEIRLEAWQVKTGRKTGRGRVVTINPTLAKWLGTCKGREFFPKNWRKEFDAVKLAAGFGTPDKTDESRKNLKPWLDDGMRHTAVSHYLRESGSYGRAAEQFGNSEAIIKAHYQGRVSSDDTKRFYALLPAKKK